LNKTVNTAVTLLTLGDPGTVTVLNPATYPTTPTTVQVILQPYLPSTFENSDYNPLLNNATAIANSAKLRKVDYSNGVMVPSNIQALRDNTADLADVQEYLYNSTGIVSGRYTGKQLYAENINVFNKGLIFNKTDIDNYIAQLNLEPNEIYYQPCSNLEIVRRVLRNLIMAYEKAGDDSYKDELTNLIGSLD
jgi:hypothetical protein